MHHTSLVHDSAELLGDYSPVESSSAGIRDFYDVIAKYTYFNQGRLVLDHQYIHSRIMNSIDWNAVTENINYNLDNRTDPNAAISEYLGIVKSHNMGISSTKIMLLLRELYIAEGGKINICQVNVKNMNARMKCCLPLTYLYEYGCFTNVETSADNGGDMPSYGSNRRGRRPAAGKSIVDKKYQVIIKALLKFSTSRNLFIMGSTSDANNRHGLTSEPERWIVSMIRCHGPKMVAYFEKCVENLVKTYISELEGQQRWDQLRQLGAPDTMSLSSMSLVAALRSILHDIVSLPGGKKKKQSKNGAMLGNTTHAKKSIPSYEGGVYAAIHNDNSQYCSTASEPKSFEWLISNISQKPIVTSASAESPVKSNSDMFYNIIEPFLHRGSVDAGRPLELPVPMAVPMTSSHRQANILPELPSLTPVMSGSNIADLSASFVPFGSSVASQETSSVGLFDGLSQTTYNWSDYGLN
ncbi:hypothetical protein LPJ53_004971 [Coemansia erecta]|uniref:Uncharacterized protein n=1 Tax=Coemansia erecta TaxID=147472 RepID=A0A9W8CP94_9FUNG|nr:hypothetical protein LPJ53_004971 [Coemansia erecta]